MVYRDDAGLGFGAMVDVIQDGTTVKEFQVDADLQAATDAVFSINGMSVSRASNTDITDVIDGVTLNIAGDAAGKTALLSIAATNDKSVTAMNDMVSKFNAALTHLTGKLAATANTVGDKTTYTRGPLTGDTVFRSLRGEMVSQFNHNVTNSGSFKNLAEIGLSLDKDLKLSLDSAKFRSALMDNPADVTALLDTAMNAFNTTLSIHTGTGGLLQNSLTNMDDQLKSLDQRISRYNDSLNLRKKSMINYYQQMQNQLSDLGNQAQMFGIDLSS
jgi:flagellar hook-associated protein 2